MHKIYLYYYKVKTSITYYITFIPNLYKRFLYIERRVKKTPVGQYQLVQSHACPEQEKINARILELIAEINKEREKLKLIELRYKIYK